MRRFDLFFVGFCAVAACAATAARADMLLQYTFPTTGGGETGPGLDPDYAHPDLDAAVLMAIRDTSSKITMAVETPTPAYASQPVLRVNPDGNASSAAAAITNGVYFSFSLKPDDGYFVNLTNLTFQAGRGGAGTPRGWALRSSLDGYAATIAGADIPTVRPNWTAYDIDLSDALYQNVTDSITFRVYVYSPAAGSTIEFDNVVLNGTIQPVPEPAAWAILLGALCVPLLVRSRRCFCKAA